MIKKFLSLIIKDDYISGILLRINECLNDYLCYLLEKSYYMRSILYREGSECKPANDNDISVYYRWVTNGDIEWLQIASFSTYAIQFFQDKMILDLGCSDGWFYRKIYNSLDNIKYTGVDNNSYLIKEAIRKSRKEKKDKVSTFIEMDFSKDLPSGDFTTVIWHGSMCMFCPSERKTILQRISDRLKYNNGILVGSATIKSNDVIWHLFKYPYRTVDDLYIELRFFFSKTYFYVLDKNSVLYMASNGSLPFELNLDK